MMISRTISPKLAHQLFEEMSLPIIRRFALLSFTTHHKPWTPFCSAIFSSSASRKPDNNGSSHEIDSRPSLGFSNTKNPENYDSAVSFIKESGSRDTVLEQIAKSRPKVLSSNPEQTITRELKILQDLGLSPAQIAIVISGYPPIRSGISQHIIERTVLALRKVFGSNYDDPGILKNLGWCVQYDLEKTMVPNVELLESCGVESSQIRNLFSHVPRFLMYKPEKFKEFVRRVDEMGVARGSRMFIYAVRTVSSMTIENWEKKRELFLSLGFSDGDILYLLRNKPHIFAMSERNIKGTAEFLLSSGKFDSSFILRRPAILNVSIDRKLRPRIQVLEILERNKILKFKPTLTVFLLSDQNFFDKYVRPHLDNVKELSSLLSPHLVNSFN